MIYRYNQTEIDLIQFEIRIDGNVIAVEPKVFDLIVYLIENRQRVISRGELFQNIWANREVSDTTLSNHIKTARNVLGDDGERQQIINTIRSRGYQFIAQIEENPKQISFNVQPSSLSNKVPILATFYHRKWEWLMTLLVTVIILTFWFYYQKTGTKSHEPILLVVPFSTITNNESWVPFTEQMTREIIQDLRKIEGITTLPPPTSFTFSNNKIRSHILNKLPQIEYVLDGAVSESVNGQIRVTVELENIQTKELIWVNDFDISSDSLNIFAVQAKIATLVSDTLKVMVLSQQQKQLASPPTDNMQAYQFYIKGQHALSKMTLSSTEQAIAMFNQAIELDDKFVQAYKAKSDAYRLLMTFFKSPKKVMPDVISSSLQVLAIKPDSAQVLSSLGLAYVHNWQWQEAWNMLNKAKQLQPDLATTELGFALYYAALGNKKKLKQALESANTLDPLNLEIAEWGMWALMMVNDIEGAIAWGTEKHRLLPEQPYPLLSLAVAKYINQQEQESIKLSEQGVSLSLNDSLPLVLLAQSYAASNFGSKALNLVAQAQSMDQYVCPYETAVVYALLDDKELMFQYLEDAVYHQSNCLIFSRNDPRLVKYHQENRFKVILKKVGLDDESIKKYPQ
ncbi:winged helix-turn-helix domain-containing protein [Shewanella electrodiphila]|uniref:Winged helix-turn-helix domain-containing protein n=1 Tax=Shewanella electrodiphila TaxID=934143 RepID=A0ABT0KK66_9GAMM|nr:winged helix-turn-helix domain-containing protein [Shewanella electrodiphila]